MNKVKKTCRYGSCWRCNVNKDGPKNDGPQLDTFFLIPQLSTSLRSFMLHLLSRFQKMLLPITKMRLYITARLIILRESQNFRYDMMWNESNKTVKIVMIMKIIEQIIIIMIIIMLIIMIIVIIIIIIIKLLLI